MRCAYEIEVPNESMETLRWLSVHGYDAGFYDLGTMTDETETHTVFSFTEPDAWQFNEESQDEAFLACCGDRALADALLGFVNKIV